MQNTLHVTSLLDEDVASTSTSLSRQFTLAEVAEHCHIESCWLALSDKVYDVTEFLSSVSCCFFTQNFLNFVVSRLGDYMRAYFRFQIRFDI